MPEGDILLCAGDITAKGERSTIDDFNQWIGELPYKATIVVAGNHDFCLEKSISKSERLLSNAIYLQDDFFEYEGIKIYGSPWQPEFYDWAFNLPRGEPLRKVWAKIPEDTDVLVTHGPPWGVLDEVPQRHSGHLGCEDLTARLDNLHVKLHVFGHIHSSYGIAFHPRDPDPNPIAQIPYHIDPLERTVIDNRILGTCYVNASICTEKYEPINAPIVVEIET